MAKELELTVMNRGARTADCIKSILAKFEAKYNTHVNFSVIPWETGHSDLVNVALYRHGADVSEIGASWISDMIAMNALRSFSSSEINSLGGRNAFVSSAMDWGSTFGDGHTYAIPWFMDPTAIFYWRERLAQVGIDEKIAFKTIPQMEQTLQKLMNSGEQSPWSMPLHKHPFQSVHNVSSWIWGAGGGLLSADGPRVTINSPQAHAGMKAYFNLHHFIAAEDLNTQDKAFDKNFPSAKSVAALGGAWLISEEFGFPFESRGEIGVSSFPGTSYVGGEALVVWKHTRMEEAAIQLVRFLTSHEAIREYYEYVKLLPTRLDVLALPEISSDPVTRVLTDQAHSGKGFPAISLWGLIEDKLESALGDVWLDIIANRDIDLDEAINKNVMPILDRLNLTLSQSGKR